MIKKILMSFTIITGIMSTAHAETVVIVEKPAPVQTVVVQESQPVVYDTTGAIIAGTTAAIVGTVLTHGHGHGRKPVPATTPAPLPKPIPAPTPGGRGHR